MNPDSLRKEYSLDFTPTQRQVEIVEIIKNNPTTNFAIKAVAGAGKTTLAKILWPMWGDRGSKMLLTFSKHLSHDLQEITNDGGTARTLHSLYTEIGNGFVNAAKIGYDWRVAQSKKEKADGKRATVEYKQAISKTVNSKIIYDLLKKYQLELEFAGVPLNNRNKTKLISMVDMIRQKLLNYRDLETLYPYFEDTDTRLIEVAAKIVGELGNHWYKTGEFDFTNLLWIPVQDRTYRFQKGSDTYAASFREMTPKFDFLFVDEIQDASPLQRRAYGLLLHENTQMVAVGDPQQSIMSFAGAETFSFYEAVAEFNLEVLDYNTTFRVPKKMVEYLNTSGLDTRIEAFEANADGKIVENIDLEYMLDEIKPGDAVIARYNVATKGFFNSTERLATFLLQNGKMVALIGRDNTATIRAALLELKLWVNRSFDSLEKALRRYDGDDEDVEVLRVYVEYIKTKYQTRGWNIEKFLETIQEDMPSALHSSQIDDEDRIYVLSGHRAKGKQYGRVWIFGFSEIVTAGDKDEALNLGYVALTRSKDTIYLNETLPVAYFKENWQHD